LQFTLDKGHFITGNCKKSKS